MSLEQRSPIGQLNGAGGMEHPEVRRAKEVREASELPPQNSLQRQAAVTIYDISFREQLQHTQKGSLPKVPIQATTHFMLVLCALLLAPLLGSAEHEFHRNAVPSSQLLSAGPHRCLQGQIGGHRRLLVGAPSFDTPQVFCGFTNDTACELKLPDHQCRKPPL